MKNILVSGMINVETTLRCECFPIEYNPVNYPFFGVETTVSGVGYNIAKALTVLGNTVNLQSIIGRDFLGNSIKPELEKANIDTDHVLQTIEETAQSVILYDKNGNRQINLDLKNLQETEYDETVFKKSLSECDLAVLCNINFNRKYLEIAKKMGKIIATDVHVISDIEDDYNNDFIRYSDILFMSNENIGGHEEDFMLEVAGRYKKKVIVTGLGDKGALIYTDKTGLVEHVDAVYTRKVVNTIGAGDALFSSFIHYYNKGFDPLECLKKAVYFASYKIGEKGAACGFIPENELEALCV